MLVYVRPSNEALRRARVPGAQDQCGCPSNPFIVGGSASKKDTWPPPSPHFNVSHFTFNFSRRIRRHEHKDFETLICVILHAVLFSSRRHRPLPWPQHLLL